MPFTALRNGFWAIFTRGIEFGAIEVLAQLIQLAPEVQPQTEIAPVDLPRASTGLRPSIFRDEAASRPRLWFEHLLARHELVLG